MYIPVSFAETELEKLYAFIRAHSFATLVSVAGSPDELVSGQPEIVASHLPLLAEPDRGEAGQLIGHMATANPQWQQLEGAQRLAIFNGPHAYISPSWIEATNAVPTWNYVAVHVYGTVRIEREPARLAEIVRAYVDFYEASMPTPWRLDAAEPEWIDRLLPAIVGFTIEVERIEGKWKLSQNHSTQSRQSMIMGLKSMGGENRHQIADLMEGTIEE